MPGWDDTRLVERAGRYARSRDGGAWYGRTWAGAASTNPDWIVITSWNEFVENTYVEPSANLCTQYLDLTRALASAWKACASAPAPQPVAQAVQTATPTRAPAATPTRTPARAALVSRPARPVECSTTVWEFCLTR